MFGFNRRRSSGGCVLGIEIGSSSVGMAIMSPPSQDARKIYWHQREFVQIGDVTDLEDREKRVINILVNMLLALGNTGLQVLRDQHPDEIVTDINITISAPWAYTTLHHVDYKQPKAFSVTNSLVEDLGKSATAKILETILNEPVIKGSALEPIDIHTVGVIVNDYLMTTYNGATKTDSLTLLQTSSVADDLIVNTTTDSIEKILPQATPQYSSFMSTWYNQVHTSFPLMKEYCLVDITSEATELGVVRNGILSHTSHILFGSYSIARELAAALTISNEEAHAYLQLDHTEIAALPEKSRAALTTTLTEYHVQLAELFVNTGDELLVPDSIFLLCDPELISLFTHTIASGAKSVTNTTHTVHPITPEVLGSPIADVALYMTTNQSRANTDNQE